MKCPHCQQTISERCCPICSAEVLEESIFCHRCGALMENPASLAPESDEEIDFSKRVLCSDGTCIGVVNEQGFCKVCGKPYRPEA